MRLIESTAGKLALPSPREIQVGRLLAHGETDKEIAYALNISVSTVKGHIVHMRQKLKLKNRVQLAIWCCLHPEAIQGIAVEHSLVLPFTHSAVQLSA